MTFLTSDSRAMVGRNQPGVVEPQQERAWWRKLSALSKVGPPPAVPDRYFDKTYDFPRFVGEPSVYLIAATPRSGSTYLGHLLFATKKLGAPLEYLNAAQYRRWSQIVGSEDPAAVFGEIMTRRTSPSGWFGLNAHWIQLANLGRFNVPHDMLKFSRIIWIRRRDLIEQAISFAIAIQTGTWTSFHKPLGKPIYDYRAIADCADAIKHMESAWAQFLTQTGTPHLSLYYEDVRANEMKTVAQILSWFGLPSLEISLSVPLQKQSNEINAAWKDRFLYEQSTLPAKAAGGSPS
jgi:LPS sulfotransferase NodH